MNHDLSMLARAVARARRTLANLVFYAEVPECYTPPDEWELVHRADINGDFSLLNSMLGYLQRIEWPNSMPMKRCDLGARVARCRSDALDFVTVLMLPDCWGVRIVEWQNPVDRRKYERLADSVVLLQDFEERLEAIADADDDAGERIAPPVKTNGATAGADGSKIDTHEEAVELTPKATEILLSMLERNAVGSTGKASKESIVQAINRTHTVSQYRNGFKLLRDNQLTDSSVGPPPAGGIWLTGKGKSKAKELKAEQLNPHATT